MTVTEILQFVDNLVFTETEKHLDDLQKKIIEEIFRGKTYKQIAEIYNYDEGYIGDESRKLFKILSEVLNQDVNKSNFCWTLERVANYNKIINFENNNINFCPNHQSSNQPSNSQSNNIDNSKQSEHDLTLAPKITRFYERKQELDCLSHWILNQNTPLISVLGLSGIGKSTLVKRFVDLNLKQFEVIIWKSLKFPKSLDLLVNDLLNTCHQKDQENIDDQLTLLFDVLSEKKCLIILDDVQNIFASGEFAGQYQTEYKDYQNFFKMITEVDHKSNIILISQEQCPEMHYLDKELYPIKSLELLGLDKTDILKNTGLHDKNSWLSLINLYEGNPMYLQDIAILIKDIFDGNVAEFLAENNTIEMLPVVTNKMRSHFNQLFNRLSPIEQQLILALSKINHPVSRENLRQDLDLSSIDLINGLQSLQQRYLVTKIKADKILFRLSPVFKEYVKNGFQY